MILQNLVGKILFIEEENVYIYFICIIGKIIYTSKWYTSEHDNFPILNANAIAWQEYLKMNKDKKMEIIDLEEFEENIEAIHKKSILYVFMGFMNGSK